MENISGASKNFAMKGLGAGYFLFYFLFVCFAVVKVCEKCFH